MGRDPTFFLGQMAAVELEKVRQLVEPIVREFGLELIACQWGTDPSGRALRILIDREGGVTVGDCQTISREVETVIEVEGLVGDRYHLEVSSPGLNRPLVKEEDFSRFAGKTAAVKTSQPIEGRRNYKGLLKGLGEGQVVMEIDGKEYRIPLGLIEKAHLVF